MLMKTMLAGGLLDGDCLTVTGKTLGENIDQVTWNPDQKVIYDVKTPITPTGGVVGLRGIARARRRDREGRRACTACSSRARRACSIARRTASPRSRRAQINEGEVIVIRYEGPKGGPGMREMLSTTAALYGLGMGEKVALITDGRFSGAHARLLHRPCRPRSGRRRPDRAGRGWRHRSASTPRPARSTSIVAEDVLAERRARVAAARQRLSVGRAVALCAERRPGLQGRGDASRRRGRNPCLRGYLARCVAVAAARRAAAASRRRTARRSPTSRRKQRSRRRRTTAASPARARAPPRSRAICTVERTQATRG